MASERAQRQQWRWGGTSRGLQRGDQTPREGGLSQGYGGQARTGGLQTHVASQGDLHLGLRVEFHRSRGKE